jgi:L-amino acid N-acyltransferase YncA
MPAAAATVTYWAQLATTDPRNAYLLTVRNSIASLADAEASTAAGQ